MRKVLAYVFVSVLIYVFAVTDLCSCPFASYKRGAYLKHNDAVTPQSFKTKEVVSRFSDRFHIALVEMQHNYPYNLVQTQEQVKQLEQYVATTEVALEKKAYKNLAKCLKLIIDKKYKAHLTSKERYKQFIESLRVVLICSEQLNDIDLYKRNFLNEILNQICYAHFTINLNHTAVGYQYFWEILPKKLAQVNPENLNVRILNRLINKLFPLQSPKIFFNKMIRKSHSLVFNSWDGAVATLRSELAHYQWADRNVSLLRMSCPIYGKNYKASVDPIFIGYLKALKAKQKKHLYINSLDTSASVHSHEYKISKLLQQLSNRENLKETLLFITLPFDSSFYKQGNLGLLRATYFKETFLNSMLLKQEGFYFPTALLTNSKFIEYLDHLMDQIHQEYFQNQEFLERVERCQFIDIAYAYITKYIIEEQKIDVVNWTCRHGIDRSMSGIAVFDVLLQSLSSSSIHLDSAIYISAWPAVLNYHRHPNPIHLVRCYSALKKLLEDKGDRISNPFIISESIQD